MPTADRRRRLSEAIEDLRRAREDVEALLAEQSSADLFDSTGSLRRNLHNVIALDEIRRAEKRADDAAKPSTADLAAEALAEAFRRSRSTSAADVANES